MSTQGRVPLREYTASTVAYGWLPDEKSFMHQFDRDLQLIVLWSNGRNHEDEVLRLIEKDFSILAQYDVTWSADKIVNNFERLYGQGLSGTFTKHTQVGAGPFLAIVVEDREPKYGYRPNVSGHVELTNLNIARLKIAARELTGGYRVHSSNNLQEFVRDATLILGVDRVDRLLAGGDQSAGRSELLSDMVGSEGWSDLHEVFATLRRIGQYVVLRNFESLPDSLDRDREIDVLCRNAHDLAALVNAVKETPRGPGSRYVCQVGGERVYFDIRHVGDGYLDRGWQSAILGRHEWRGGIIPVPRRDDYFFSLLYHAKIQKPAVKESYRPRLATLAHELGAVPKPSADVCEDDIAAALLDGFLAAHGYSVPRPVDRGVHRNKAFLTKLRLTQPDGASFRAATKNAKEYAIRSRVGRSVLRRGPVRRLYRYLKHDLKR